MTYILILIFWTNGTPPAVAATTAEFDDEEACHAAAIAAREEWEPMWGNRVVFICAPQRTVVK